jgi:ATP-dependent DNA helicase RecG
MISTENRFSGIPTVYREIKKAKLPEPVFENKHGIFKVIFYKASVVEMLREMDIGNDNDLETRVLAFCKVPKSREELANEFGFDSPYYMVTRYIRPLVKDGRLKMTLPGAPRSKKQRYYS